MLTVYEGVCAQAVERLGLPPTASAHLDTTSISLSGAYPDSDAGARPARGFNKDGKRDGLQLVSGLVTRADGVPASVEVHDGNLSDSTWTYDTLRRQHPLPSALRESLIFVADSKMVSEAAVAACAEGSIRFVSRLPNSFKLEQTAKAQAQAAERWDTERPAATAKEATRYRLWETTGTIGAETVRVIVVHSSALEAKAHHWRENTVTRDAERLDREITRWADRRFACEADATTAWKAWQRTKAVAQAVWDVDATVVQPDATASDPTWRLVVTRSAEPRNAVLDAGVFRRSTFVLVSNDPGRTARQLLQAYKTQFVNEQDHAVVKGPLQVAPLFLKDTKRMEAYVYCVYLGLLLWRCMEAVMRKNQARLGITLPYPNQALQPAPTTKRLRELVQPIQILHWRDTTGSVRRSRSELTLAQRQALLLLGMDTLRFIRVPSG